MTSSVISPASASVLRTSSTTSAVVMPSGTVRRRCTTLPDCSSSTSACMEMWAGTSYSPALIGLGVGSIIKATRNSCGWAITPCSCSTFAMVAGPGAARNDDVLGLVERPLGGQQLVADEQRAAHQGREQGDEEQNPTEIAEHASASGDQTGPTINEALVPPKPNELLSA